MVNLLLNTYFYIEQRPVEPADLSMLLLNTTITWLKVISAESIICFSSRCEPYSDFLIQQVSIKHISQKKTEM